MIEQRLIRSAFTTVKVILWRRLLSLACILILSLYTNAQTNPQYRLHISINDGWRFMRYDSEPDKLLYDVRPDVSDRNDNVVADTKPSESISVTSEENVLKKWILPTANDFIKDPTKHHKRPVGKPRNDFPFIQNIFNDNAWQQVNLPHDWAINGPASVEIKSK